MTRRTRYFMFGSIAVLLVGLCTGLVAYYTGMPMGAFAAPEGPPELRYVPAEASVVAYADVRNLMQSQLRQKLHESMERDKRDGHEEFERETGIDIEHDIDRVVAYLLPTAGEKRESRGLVLAAGRFDQGRLEALALQHDGRVEEYGGKRIISTPGARMHDHDRDGGGKDDDDPEDADAARAHRKGSMTLAFLEPGLVAVGESEAVKAAIDRTGGSSVLANTELMNLVRDVDSSSAWAVGRFDELMANADLPDGVAGQIPAVRLFSASGNINGGITGRIRAEARDDQAAQNLREVVQGFLALARLQTGSNPDIQQLVSSLQLSGTGRTVVLSFDLPEQVIESLADSRAKVMKHERQH
jgi:hypothetical protein